MNSETRLHSQSSVSTKCQNCKKDFTIEPDDFLFYEKIKVPPPTWCPECRLMRRLSFLNWFSLYKRPCDSCNKPMFSTIHGASPLKVFCPTCWWADNWDGTEYSMDYDSSKPFFVQMLELRNRSIYMANENLHSTLVNSPYVNATSYQKDCYMVFNADYGDKTAYCMIYAHVAESLDGYRLKNVELCYECVGIYKCYHCIYSEELDSCSDTYFSRSCSGCTDCIGCINLKNKSYCIFNEQYSKEEYKERLDSFKLDTRKGIKNMFTLSRNFWNTKPRRATVGNSLNVNTTGDFVYESKNTKDAYMVSGAEDSRYVQMLTMPSTKNCYDYTNWGDGAENLYECLTVGMGANGDRFCVQCWPNAINNEYCTYTIQSKDCFGCVNLKRKEYCILNKQYTKEEYFKLKNEIIESMEINPYVDVNGRIWKYGEQIPLDISPFAYNETIAQSYFPLTKDEAKEKGISWFEAPEANYVVTLKAADIPESIAEIPESITREVVECNTCKKGFNIVELEVYLHKKIKVPLSENCWKCRFKRRFETVNKPSLYNRTCDKCSTSIITSYAPDRPEIVYCEKCFQQEVS